VAISKRRSEFVRGVEKAYERIRNDIIETPLEYSALLSLALGSHIYFKWECDQTTGSFKLRGALNKIRTLSPALRKKGVVSASTGNHGLGVAYASKLEGLDLTLFLPVNASPDKIGKLQKTGAALRFFGKSCEKTEMQARQEAEASGRAFISPYNDLAVVQGQGTVGLEIWKKRPDVEDVLVPVGGGGLVAGIGAYLKFKRPGVRIYGVEPVHSAFMKASLDAGRLVEIREKRTLADAVAGGIEPGSMTFSFCQEYVDEILTVSEAFLKKAMQIIYGVQRRVVEGAGALTLAALMRYPRKFHDRKVVLVVSGKNISWPLFERICHTAKI